MKTLLPLMLAFATIGCGGAANRPAQPPPMAAPQPAPAPAPAPAPVAAPAPTPPAAPAPRDNVLGLLDKIDHQLKECADKKMHQVTPHAESITDLVNQLEGPIATFPQVSKEFGKLKTQARKFEVACKQGHHKDQHHHHHELGEVVSKIRSSI